MAISAKPTGWTVNTGHAKCPDHLYMLQDSTGATTVDDAVGSLNLTADATTMWATDDTGSGYGQILRFNPSQKAISGATFAATSGICLVVIARTDGTNDPLIPTSDQNMFSLGHSTTSGIYGGVGISGLDGYLDGRVDSGGSTNIKTISTNVADGGWRMFALKTNDATSSDGVTSLSINGAAWQSNAGTGDQNVAAFNRIALGCRAASTPNEFFDGDILAAFVYLDDYSTWDDAWIASVYSDPWQFLTTTTTYVKLVAPSDAEGETVEGVVLNAARDTVIGEFTGQTFAAGTGDDAGFAVLLIDVADISPDGSTLTTSDTPLISAKGSTYGTVGLPSATVIEA